MPMSAVLHFDLTVKDSDGSIALSLHEKNYRWTPTVLKRETVSFTGAAFTALSPPSGAKVLIILPGSGVSWILKGVTGDSASITVAPASNPLGVPLVLPLGASPAIGVLNNGATATATVIWA